MMMIPTLLLLILCAIFQSSIIASDASCCLCSDCDMMMDLSVQLYDAYTQTLFSCERLAEELSLLDSQQHQCGIAQSLFQSKCCLIDQIQHRKLWNAKPYQLVGDSWGSAPSTTTTTAVFDSRQSFGGYTPWPKTPTKPAFSYGYTPWPAPPKDTNEEEEEEVTFAQAPPSQSQQQQQQSFGNAPQGGTQYQRGQIISSTPGFKNTYTQCPRASHTCYLHCDTMDINKQDFTVSVDMSLSGRSGSFSTECYNLQNYFNCENILNTDIRCGMTRSAYFSVCGCVSHTGWKPNQLLQDYGNTEGVVGQWWIK